MNDCGSPIFLHWVIATHYEFAPNSKENKACWSQTEITVAKDTCDQETRENKVSRFLLASPPGRRPERGWAVGQAAWVLFLFRNEVSGSISSRLCCVSTASSCLLLHPYTYLRTQNILSGANEEAEKLHDLLKRCQSNLSPWALPLLITVCGLKQITVAFGSYLVKWGWHHELWVQEILWG